MSARFRALSRRALVAGLALASIGVAGLGTSATDAAASHPSTASVSRAGHGPELTADPSGGTGPLLRILKWSGYTWLVFPADQNGPEQTKLNSSEEAVHVDSHGRLHLKITKVNGVWRGAELESLNPITYGTYHWVVGSRVAKFARSTVLGLFVYRPGARKFTDELDVEDSQFSHLTRPNNAQFAVQPYTAPHHYHQYYIRATHPVIYQQFTWLAGTQGNGIARFATRAGRTSHGPLISRWSYRGDSVPTPMNEHLFINLWLNTNRPPTGGTHAAIIRSFHFTPAA